MGHVSRGGIRSEWWGIEWLGAQPGVTDQS